MSFLFDDDNDDNAFSQTYQTLSQKQVNFSQSSAVPVSQVSSLFSPEKSSQSSYSGQPLFVSPLKQSQSQQTPKREVHVHAHLHKPNSQQQQQPTFVCHNCGTIDEYYHDEAAGGIVTCSRCFTQSTTYGAVQEELDYEETQHMAARNRDGTFKRVGVQHRGGKAGVNPDGTAKRGRPAKPLEDFDRTQKPPSLEACLAGFQTVLQKSCKILCFELMVDATTEVQSKNHAGSVSDSGDERKCDTAGNRPPKNNNKLKQKKELYRQVSKTVKGLWKAYLLSWKEGADFYSSLYPQIRFALRDQFIGIGLLKILYRTLAASAQNTLAQQVHKEAEAEDFSSEEDSDNSESESDAENDDCAPRMSKMIKAEVDKKVDGNVKTVKTEIDVLFDMFDRNSGSGTEKMKSENANDDNRAIVKEEQDVPVPNVVLSNDSKTSFLPHRSRFHRRRRNRGIAYGDNNITSSRNYNNDHDWNDTGNNRENDYDDFSVASDLSVCDAAENNSKTKYLRKRKRTIEREKRDGSNNSVFAKMIYYHNKLMQRNSKSKHPAVMGRKEAALVLSPSMRLIMGILLVAASSHGVTEGKMVEWVENGSLPILHAFTSLLSKTQQTTLAMVAPFFSLPITPNASSLQRIVAKIHVACGYRAPEVKLVTPPSPFQQQQQSRIEEILTDKKLSRPGRLVRPDTVPLVLGLLVSELGFSQRVLNYSLALMGLPVSRQSLKTTTNEKRRNKKYRDKNHSDVKNDNDKVNDISDSISDPNQSNENLEQGDISVSVSDPGQSLGKLEQDDVSVSVSDPSQSMEKLEQDLTKPAEIDQRPRYYRYDNKSAARRCRERRRKKLALLMITKHREKKLAQARLEKRQNRINTEWLPPPLEGARLDLLIDTDRILAIVVVACKLIPGWESNHQYVFSQGQCPPAENNNTCDAIGVEEDEIMNESGGSGGVFDAGRFKATNRFVPWSQEQLRFIRNGKTELDYLGFLKEGIFRGNNYALPKFVESLNKSSSTPTDGHVISDEGPVEEEGIGKNQSKYCDGDSDENSKKNGKTVVVPNELVLGWKKNLLAKSCVASGKNNRVQMQMPYRLTTLSETRGLRTPNGPLGPLIEYIAHKTGTCPKRILKHLIKFDKEMGLKGKPRKRRHHTVPLDVCYNHFMRDYRTSTRATKPRTPPRNIRIQRSLTPAAPIKKDPDINWEFDLTQASLRSDQLGRDCILTQRTPLNNDFARDYILTQGSPEDDDFDRDYILTQRSHGDYDFGRDFITAQRSPVDNDLSSVASIYEV